MKMTLFWDVSFYQTAPRNIPAYSHLRPVETEKLLEKEVDAGRQVLSKAPTGVHVQWRALVLWEASFFTLRDSASVSEAF
jgi:hypothetical protein